MNNMKQPLLAELFNWRQKSNVEETEEIKTTFKAGAKIGAISILQKIKFILPPIYTTNGLIVDREKIIDAIIESWIKENFEVTNEQKTN